MNGYEEDNPCCYIHHKEVIVGICALCLKERLLILSSKQKQLPLSKDTPRSLTVLKRKPTIALPKVFALGSFLHRLGFRHRKPDDDSDEDSIASLEDSFISMKFEDNGRPSWDTKKATSVKPSHSEANSNTRCNQEQRKESKGGRSTTTVVEHTKPQGMLRWRKRIGQLLQMVRWKRPNKAHVCHVGLAGKVEGVKWRMGWMGSLTRRRTTTIDQ